MSISKSDSSVTSNVVYGSIDDPEQPDADPQISAISFHVIIGCSFANAFLASLDGTLVTTLLGVIASDLQAMENISWIGTSYLLSCAAFQPIFGKLSDIFGRKPLILFCMALFGVGCVFCATSKTMLGLIIARFVSGIGGGGLNSLSSIVLSDIVPLRKRGLYQGYVNIFFYLGAVAGGILAGIFQRFLGWRFAFFIQGPVCLVNGAILAKYFALPKGSPGLGIQGPDVWTKLKQIDYFGSIMLVLSLFGLLLACSVGGKDIEFSDPRFSILILASIAAGAIFYHYDLKVCEQPIIPVKLLHNKSVLACCMSCWFVSMNVFCCTFYLPFYWTSVKNLSPLESGLRLIPSMVTSSIGSISAGYIIKKTCSYHTLKYTSGIITVLGSILIFMSSKDSSVLWDSLVSAPQRYSTSSVITLVLVAMLSSVDPKDQALVTSIQYCFRSTGSTLGVSISAAILQIVLKRKLNTSFAQIELPPGVTAAQLEKIKTAALKDPTYAFNKAPDFIRATIIDSYDVGCHGAFWFLIATGLVTFACMLYIVDHDVSKTSKGDIEEEDDS